MAVIHTVFIGIITTLFQCHLLTFCGDVPLDGNSNLDRIKHIFPGRYDNRFQHKLDNLRNISESLRHQFLHVNISLVNKTITNGVADFLFVAVDPQFKEFPSSRLFTVRNFNITNQLLVQVGSVNIGEDDGLSKSCDMMWEVTGESFRNQKAVPCSVQGPVDKYVVNTWFELTEQMFSVEEHWTILPEKKTLPGPTSPYRFIKQPLNKPNSS